jgi:hypothetical protein
MNFKKWVEVAEYLEETKKDCLELKRNNDLSCEGAGMLMQIKAIEEILGGDLR